MEWKLFDGDIAGVSTRVYHKDRERARHLEQPGHRERLIRAAAYCVEAEEMAARDRGKPVTFSDLGCGDGGLLSLVHGTFARAWGYDFCPANLAGCRERGVWASDLDVFGDDWRGAEVGTVCAMTEVLEHLTDPHQALKWVRNKAVMLVCSSPFSETDRTHAPEHAWAWDELGYEAMLRGAGWEPVRHSTMGSTQLVLAQ